MLKREYDFHQTRQACRSFRVADVTLDRPDDEVLAGLASTCKHRGGAPDFDRISGGRAGTVALQVLRVVEVLDASVGICRSDGCRLGLGAGTGDSRCSAITVGGGTADDGADRVAVPQSIIKTLKVNNVHAFSLGIPISLSIEAVASARG